MSWSGRSFAALSLLLLAACAPPAPGRLTPEEAADTATRFLLRPVPVPPSVLAARERGTRTGNGEPGPNYWQQRVRYRIEAELDPETALLRGRERIVYHNRSPAALPDVVLNLYQNVFSQGVPRNRTVPVTGGVTLERVVAQGQALEVRTPQQLRVAGDARVVPGYSVQGTIARLLLPRPVAPGDSVVLEIDWRHTVPPTGAFRTAWEDALGGRVFQVAQWYPQVATFDDVRGWNTTPYLGDGEFYLEYGDWDVSLTLPAGWLVGASGELQNAAEVLTPEARQRLQIAATADTTVRVVS
ncbi:MAG: M1 family peptidase, partial [Gemmatimonadota bacterium]|nr:M1 family peptidase [Gemmatimonadota bacterium]